MDTIEYLFAYDDQGNKYAYRNRLMTTEVKNNGHSLIEMRKAKLAPHIEKIVAVVQQTIEALLSDPKNSERDISRLVGHRLIESHREDASPVGVELTRIGKKLVHSKKTIQDFNANPCTEQRNTAPYNFGGSYR